MQMSNFTWFISMKIRMNGDFQVRFRENVVGDIPLRDSIVCHGDSDSS